MLLHIELPHLLTSLLYFAYIISQLSVNTSRYTLNESTHESVYLTLLFATAMYASFLLASGLRAI